MFKDSYRFQEAANNFLKNGVYCDYPKGTYKYKDFWIQEDNRCRYGHTVDGVTITGDHYFYLNYIMINAVYYDEKLGIYRTGLRFPSFLDMDYKYFHACQLALKNSKGIIVGKARRKGFSYKNAAKALHQALFFRESKTIIGAFKEEYCQGTMNMIHEMLPHINTHTEFRKRTLISRSDKLKFGYKEMKGGLYVDSGLRSEIQTLTFKDNPRAGLGKKANLFLFEEAGEWRDLVTAFKLMQPTMYDGNIMIGQAIIFGTGGDMDSGTVDFCEMFYNPDLFGLQEFDNIWDKDAGDKKCGYFVPMFEYAIPFVDDDGNSLIEEAISFENKKRQKMLDEGKRREYEVHVTQYPYTPKEAFLQVTGNIFPTSLLQEQLSTIITSKKAESFGQRGRLELSKDKVTWKPDSSLSEAPFPFNESITEGCITIYEHPVDNSPFGLYIAGCDPYNQDQAKTSSSLGSTFIFKRFKSTEESYNVIVAEYTGRPRNGIDEYYENLRLLLIYYNAQVLYESEIKYIKSYFQNKNCLRLLKPQPTIIKDIVKDSVVNRTYGMPMSRPIKLTGVQFIRDWLLEVRGKDEKDNDIYNLNTIQCPNLLRELIAYNETGNFDRVIAFMMVMFFLQDIYKVQVTATHHEEMVKMFSGLDKKLGW